MIQAMMKTAGKELAPEEVTVIKTAQKKHAAVDPACVNLTPEEFINWHPVGGISWEERAKQMSEKLQKSGKVLINSTGSLNLLPGTMELSRNDSTFHWFVAFLEKSVTLEERKTDGKTYIASRDESGNVFLREVRHLCMEEKAMGAADKTDPEMAPGLAMAK